MDVTYTVAVRDSALIVQMPGRPDIALQPIAPDTFEGFSVVKFSRDTRKAVTGFTRYGTGARSLRFERVRR